MCFLSIFAYILFLIFRICLDDESLHESCGYDASAYGSEKADERLRVESLAYHEHYHEKSHSECCAEVGQRDELVLLEIAAELFVLGERNDRRIV